MSIRRGAVPRCAPAAGERRRASGARIPAALGLEAFEAQRQARELLAQRRYCLGRGGIAAPRLRARRRPRAALKRRRPGADPVPALQLARLARGRRATSHAARGTRRARRARTRGGSGGERARGSRGARPRTPRGGVPPRVARTMPSPPPLYLLAEAHEPREARHGTRALPPQLPHSSTRKEGLE